jgi:hypothetical protein
MATISAIRKAIGIAMRRGTLARATMAMLLLTSWGAASARGEEQRLHHVRPLAFEANRGQADEQVKFLARGAGYTVFLTSTDALVSLRDGRAERAVVRVKPVGARAAARIVADSELPGVVNYAGRAPGAAPISAPTYARVRYVDLLACADDTKVAPESTEANNGHASGTAVVAAPEEEGEKSR